MKTVAIVLLAFINICSVYGATKTWYELKEDELYVADFLLQAGKSKKIVIGSANPLEVGFKIEASFAPDSNALYQQLSKEYKGYVIRLTDNIGGNSVTSIMGGSLKCQPRKGKIIIEVANLTDKAIKVVIYK